MNLLTAIIMTASIFFTGAYFGAKMCYEIFKEEGENQDVKSKR